MIKFNLTFFLLVGFASLFLLVGCEKGDEYYARYENEIQVFDGSTYDYLESRPGVYDSLLLVLDRLVPLRDTLRHENVTLFALTNKSFELAIQNLNNKRATSNNVPLYLEDIDRISLDSIMCRYIFSDLITTDSVSHLIDGVVLPSLKNHYEMHIQYDKLNASGFVEGAQQQLIFTDPNESIFERYWQRTPTNSVNIRTRNGIIHVLSPSHDFGFNKLGQWEN
ncbi:hypothetical protein [Albibacterium profundi]|uniref:FAS1 domain-containing protein n=1 Tax=Albibacterium profundi TaxID=3134906 RepID=A0ABV5CCI8_9SPHI